MGQFRIVRRKGAAQAFVTRAFLDEDAEARLTDGARKLRPSVWNSGEQPWVIDVFVPFGGADDILQTLRKAVFLGKKVKMLQRSPDGDGVAVVEW
ncbi:toxin-activating lysine-acyltransferase [Rhodospirillaceae bacterium KN72]|uniref:RTX toxin-activating lysine-acyltransferase n=1 Tax=Pacificispira spongiicola TaxID=2729598 RepID=A0A7Y0HFD8_9PROT|nr:toxin-activating lysine-acyltransferase [Pacificispira spongiicola]